MAKPDMSKLYAGSDGIIFRELGVGLQTLTSTHVIQRQILKRTIGTLPADTPLDLVSPGSGWEIHGDPIEVTDGVDLLTNVKIYRNGQLLTVDNDFGSDFDFYFVEENKIAFVFSIRTSEVLQISKNFDRQ